MGSITLLLETEMNQLNESLIANTFRVNTGNSFDESDAESCQFYDIENSKNNRELKGQDDDPAISKSTPRIDVEHVLSTRRKFSMLFSSDFWRSQNFIEDLCEILFHVKKRKTTVELEIWCGVIQFISCKR